MTPTLADIQAAVPKCPGGVVRVTNIMGGRGNHQPCGRPMHWDHDKGCWACEQHPDRGKA